MAIGLVKQDPGEPVRAHHAASLAVVEAVAQAGGEDDGRHRLARRTPEKAGEPPDRFPGLEPRTK
jgi:hypothetical protein